MGKAYSLEKNKIKSKGGLPAMSGSSLKKREGGGGGGGGGGLERETRKLGFFFNLL